MRLQVYNRPILSLDRCCRGEKRTQHCVIQEVKPVSCSQNISVHSGSVADTLQDKQDTNIQDNFLLGLSEQGLLKVLFYIYFKNNVQYNFEQLFVAVFN